MRGIRSPVIGDQWPFQGRGVQAGQYRAAPPAFLMARSVRRVPSQMRIRVKPIPACQMTATSRAPCPAACRSSRSRRSSVQCWTCRQFVLGLAGAGRSLVAGQVAGKPCRRVAGRSLKSCRDSGTVLGNCELGS